MPLQQRSPPPRSPQQCLACRRLVLTRPPPWRPRSPPLRAAISVTTGTRTRATSATAAARLATVRTPRHTWRQSARRRGRPDHRRPRPSGVLAPGPAAAAVTVSRRKGCCRVRGSVRCCQQRPAVAGAGQRRRGGNGRGLQLPRRRGSRKASLPHRSQITGRFEPRPTTRPWQPPSQGAGPPPNPASVAADPAMTLTESCGRPDPEGLTAASRQRPQKCLGRGHWRGGGAQGPRPPPSWLERGMATIGCRHPRSESVWPPPLPYPVAAVVRAGVAAVFPKVWPAPPPGAVPRHCPRRFCGSGRHQPRSPGRRSASAAAQRPRLPPSATSPPRPLPPHECSRELREAAVPRAPRRRRLFSALPQSAELPTRSSLVRPSASACSLSSPRATPSKKRVAKGRSGNHPSVACDQVLVSLHLQPAGRDPSLRQPQSAC